MNNSNKTKPDPKEEPAQANAAPTTPKARTIKLGIDVHLDRYVVVRIVDGGRPQPPQRFGPPEFLLWVAKQITQAEKVFTCYEAGPFAFGYSLLGATGSGVGLSQCRARLRSRRAGRSLTTMPGCAARVLSSRLTTKS